MINDLNVLIPAFQVTIESITAEQADTNWYVMIDSASPAVSDENRKYRS